MYKPFFSSSFGGDTRHVVSSPIFIPFGVCQPLLVAVKAYFIKWSGILDSPRRHFVISGENAPVVTIEPALIPLQHARAAT